MSAIDNARAALASYEAAVEDPEQDVAIVSQQDAPHLAAMLRDLIAEHERLTAVTDEMVDRVAQSLTGLSDELWAENRREPHVAYYVDSARRALEAAFRVPLHTDRSAP